MSCRCFLSLLAALCLAGCAGLHKDKSKDKKKKPDEHTMADQSGDVSFQGFIGRLRKAAAARDMQALAAMMTPDFGYRLEPPGEGEGVFQYWDENGLWKELQLVLADKFVPKGDYMVSPPQFA